MFTIQIEKIVASGCSFTFGEELADPSSEAWPSLLSKNFNASVENLGWPGSSNEHIVNKIIDYCATNNTSNNLFVVMFSHFSRQTFCRSENANYLRHISISWPAEYDKGLKELLFTKYYNQDYLLKKTFTQIILLQNFFKANNYPYIMCTAMSGAIPKIIPEDLNPLVKMIDKTKYKNFYTDNFDTLTNPEFRAAKGHPDARAHKQMADIITNWIKHDYQV